MVCLQSPPRAFLILSEAFCPLYIGDFHQHARLRAWLTKQSGDFCLPYRLEAGGLGMQNGVITPIPLLFDGFIFFIIFVETVSMVSPSFFPCERESLPPLLPPPHTPPVFVSIVSGLSLWETHFQTCVCSLQQAQCREENEYCEYERRAAGCCERERSSAGQAERDQRE